jgi:hypothetical protein
LAITLVALGLVARFGPLEKSLGTNIRLIYLHGAWVWTGMGAFALSALAGLAGLILRRSRWHTWSRALGYTGMTYWLTYLPMSLLMMQLNWGGFFFAEPRWKIPFSFAVIGLLLQAGLWLIRQPALTSVANLIFGIALLWSLRNIASVLHPDSPILTSDSNNIRLFFLLLLAFSVIAAAQIANLWHRWASRQAT